MRNRSVFGIKFYFALLSLGFCLVSASAQVLNDNFTNSLLITGTSGTLVGNNSLATPEPGDPIHAETLANHSVWFNWTALTTGAVAFDTLGSSFDTVLAVYTGADLVNLTAIATNNDVTFSNTTSRLVFRANAGTTYQILLDGASANSGDFTLNWQSDGPDNDDFTSALSLAGDAGQIAGTTSFATREPGEPFHFNDNPGGHSVWFHWTAPFSEYLTVDTFGSGFDTLMAIYSGDELPSLTRLASSDDFFEFTTNKSSRVQIPVSAGVTYFIALDGFNGAYGNFTLNWQATVLLTMTHTNANHLVLSWPADSFGFVLESSPVISNANAWSAVTNEPVNNDENWSVMLPQTTNACFFRLRKS